MRNLVIAGFVLMVVAQWYAPLSMVYDSEKTIDEGTVYNFKTMPVDPTDPFRGKYITLNFEGETYYPADTNELHFEPGQKVYATITADVTGYARITGLTAAPPEEDVDYIAMTFQYSRNSRLLPAIDAPEDAVIYLDFPFKRYYLEESKASEAEKVYWNSNRANDNVLCYAKVSVHKGNATLTDVMVNDRSITDVVREMNASEN